MDQTLFFLTILGMMVVTFLPRMLPAWLLSSRQLPPLVIAWLRFVPAAVLAALLAPAIMIEGGSLNIAPANLYLLAFFPTLFVGWKTRSLFGAVMVGMAVVALGRLL